MKDEKDVEGEERKETELQGKETEGLGEEKAINDD